MTLADLQQQTVAALERDPWLIEREVIALAENRGDIEAAVAEAIARIGICAFVATPGFTPELHDGALSGTGELRIIIYEEPPINRARAAYCTALDAAEHIYTVMRAWDNLVHGPMRQIEIQDAGVAVEIAATVHILHGPAPATPER